MNKVAFSALLIFMFGGGGQAIATPLLSVTVDCPPVLSRLELGTQYVGMDFGLPVGPQGSQGESTHLTGTIPGSTAEAINQATDDDPEPTKNGISKVGTGWSMSVRDPQSDSYRLRLKAVADGISVVNIWMGKGKGSKPTFFNIPVFVEKGKTYVYELVGVRSKKTLALNSITVPGIKLQKSVLIARSTGAIGGELACNALEELAKKIDQALSNHDFQVACSREDKFLRLLAFMHEHKKGKDVPFGCRDKGDEDFMGLCKGEHPLFALEPAYSALKDLVETQLYGCHKSVERKGPDDRRK